MGSKQSKQRKSSSFSRSGDRGSALSSSDTDFPHVWYRHSGECEIDGIPTSPTFRIVEDEHEIAEDLGNHHITHLYIKSYVLPPLIDLAPKVTHLKIEGLTDLSQLQSVIELSRLKSLDLSCNDFSRGLPAHVGRLANLEELWLSSCQLSALPSRFSSLTQLKRLNLDSNNFSAGLPRVVGRLSALEKLSLFNCQLTDLPLSLRALTHLRVLSLRTNNFSKGFPAVIGGMVSMEKLCLKNCHISELPHCLSSLSQIKSLNFDFNNFSKGIATVPNLSSTLEELSLGHCQLTDLPPRFSSLTQLKLLNLDCNNFTSGLPTVVGQLDALEELSLDSCQLSGLPHSLTALKHLKMLNLNSNNLSREFPTSVRLLSALEDLWLGDCQLSSLPQSLSSLKSLKLLSLYSNNFSKGLPEVVGELISLEELSLDSCQLSDLPQNFHSLSKLKRLNLNSNNFSAGLPRVVGRLSALQELSLFNCQLTDLPLRFQNETHVEVLDLRENRFEYFPSLVRNMDNLRKLDLSRNYVLTGIDDISGLAHLVELNCFHCESLQYPPLEVCSQGILALKKYFNDINIVERAHRLPVPVVIMGNHLAGKDSLIRSLQSGKRILTFKEVATKEFDFVNEFGYDHLPLRDSGISISKYTEYDDCHGTYQPAMDERCIPLIVVNMAEFGKLSYAIGSREATRLVCFDWLVHFYLSHPSVGPPLLVLTHTDKFTDQDSQRYIDALLNMSETMRRAALQTDQQCSGLLSKLQHLGNNHLPLFDSTDVFRFNNDFKETSNIELLCKHLNNRCKVFSKDVPLLLWEEVDKFIRESSGKPYIGLSNVTSEFVHFPSVLQVLRHMHSVGQVLYLEKNEKLSSYIFHQLPEITNMILAVFHQTSEEQIHMLIDKFTPFSYNGMFIGVRRFKSLVQQYSETGLLDEALLVYMLGTEFPVEIAISLLECFFILHGPIKQTISRKVYILPRFSRTSMGDSWKTDTPVPLRLDVVFEDFCPPPYVYQLMTIEVLDHTANPLTNVVVKSDGVTIHHGECSTHLIHNYTDRSATLQVSTTVAMLSISWKHLIETAKKLLSLFSRVWAVGHPEILQYCAQCLLTHQPNPGYDMQPDYIYSAEVYANITTLSPLQKVSCPGCSNKQLRPTVPKPLKFPCGELTPDEINTLETYIAGLKHLPAAHPTETNMTSTASHSSVAVNSDLSDVEDEGYCDTYSQPELVMRMKAVRQEKIKLLYNDSDKIYLMSDRVRGRVLILNTYMISSAHRFTNKDGSYVDYQNIARMFEHLRFTVVKSQKELSDLTVEEIYEEIKTETQNREHVDLGVFVLVIMSCGQRDDIILDVRGEPIPLTNILDLLSPANFPAMKDKPKLVIVQACSGARVDAGDQLPVESTPSTDQGIHSLETNAPPVPATSTTATAEPLVISPTPLNTEARVKPFVYADDFLIMKASSESYVAVRSHSHGSWFTRVLVATFYKHACHRDVESLFQIIQQRVRQVSMSHMSSGKDYALGGNVPTSVCTFTNYRKLFLFPGYPHIRR